MMEISQLYEKYPEIFRVDSNDNSPFSHFGIECGRGWYVLIDELCTSLTKIAIQEKRPPPQVHQVKEKFGRLRFYVSNASDEMYLRINEAEDSSSQICELCGERGKRVDVDGWWSTLCPVHLAECY
jgi:hypothetical protein